MQSAYMFAADRNARYRDGSVENSANLRLRLSQFLTIGFNTGVREPLGFVAFAFA